MCIFVKNFSSVNVLLNILDYKFKFSKMQNVYQILEYGLASFANLLQYTFFKELEQNQTWTWEEYNKIAICATK